MKLYMLGILTLPAAYIAWLVLTLLYRTMRDAYRTIRHYALKDGVSRWNWLRIVPLCCIYCLREQAWSMWNGINSEVMP